MTEEVEPEHHSATESHASKDEFAPTHEREHRPTIVLGVNFSPLNEKELNSVPDAIKNLPETLDFVPGINLIVGHNAQGKSTLLEAIWGTLIAYSKGISVREARETISHDVKAIKLNLSLTVGSALEVRGLADGFADLLHFDYTESAVEESRAGGGFGAAFATNNFHTKSQRESREKRFNSSPISKIDKDKQNILLLDEPEHGLDPWRHRDIRSMISELASPDSTIIVATNSPVLVADESLPRIDLRYPKDGLTYHVR